MRTLASGLKIMINPGRNAVNENETETVKDFKSKASNSPFINWDLPGKIHYTICSGNIVYENN